jgi:hypothetical protein
MEGLFQVNVFVYALSSTKSLPGASLASLSRVCKFESITLVLVQR